MAQQFEIITIKKIQYYNAAALFGANKKFFKGCRNTWNIIEKKELEDDEYTYAVQKDGKWKITDGNSKKVDQVLITKAWADDNFPKVIEVIEDVPDIITLTKNEKMKDVDGKILEIEVRGERIYDKIYFKLEDISIGFNMPNLQATVIREKSSYDINNHFKIFKSIKKTGAGNVQENYFLTYKGLLKCLHVSKSESAAKFIDWACKTLFTAHLGTKNQKEKMALKMLGVPQGITKETLNLFANALPVCYFLTIGFVRDLRADLQIPLETNDDYLVCRPGNTDDLHRRIGEHQSTFGKMNKANLCLKTSAIVDPEFLFLAEKDLFDFFYQIGAKFTHPKYDEIVIVKNDKDIMKSIKKQFENIGLKYSSYTKQMIINFNNATHKNDLQQKDVEHLTKDNINKDLQIIREREHSQALLDNKNKELKMAHELFNLKTELADKKHQEEIQRLLNLLKINGTKEDNNIKKKK